MSQRDVPRDCALIGYWPYLGGGGGWVRTMYSAFPGNCSVSYLSFDYGRSLWAELNGGENSLHWKANMLPLFSIITLCYQQIVIRMDCDIASFFVRIRWFLVALNTLMVCVVFFTLYMNALSLFTFVLGKISINWM